MAEYAAGLKDLDGISHVILLYEFHRSRGFDCEVVPFLDSASHGVLLPGPHDVPINWVCR